MKNTENGNVLIYSADLFFDENRLEFTTVFKKMKEFLFESNELLNRESLMLLNGLNSETTKAVVIFLPLTIAAEEVNLIENNILIGLYYYEHLADISEIIKSVKTDSDTSKRELVVLAMWKDFSLKIGEKVYQALLKGFRKKNVVVNRWFADDVSRNSLVKKLFETDISLVLYLGHGRSRGWSAYRGLRWHHFSFKDNSKISVVIAMSCDNLKFENDEIPFGVKWVIEKRAEAFLGAVGSVQITPMKRICSLFSELFSQGQVATIGDLILLINNKIIENENEQVQDCWSKFRLVGNPFARF